jgi:DNA polymerase epsilon subunit 1
MARGSTFGLSSRRPRGGGGGGRGWRGSRSRGRGRGGSSNNQPPPARGDDGTQVEERFESVKVNDEVDEKLGFPRLSEGPRQEGWLVNMHPVSGTIM